VGYEDTWDTRIHGHSSGDMGYEDTGYRGTKGLSRDMGIHLMG
jgi:hypothetical protein